MSTVPPGLKGRVTLPSTQDQRAGSIVPTLAGTLSLCVTGRCSHVSRARPAPGGHRCRPLISADGSLGPFGTTGCSLPAECPVLNLPGTCMTGHRKPCRSPQLQCHKGQSERHTSNPPALPGPTPGHWLSGQLVTAACGSPQTSDLSVSFQAPLGLQLGIPMQAQD